MEFAPVRGKRMRATVTDECGLPSTGAGDSVVTKGFITVSMSPEVKARDEIERINAGGEVCVLDTIKPQLKWMNVEIEFCKVNPELFAMFTGQTIVEGWDTNPVGVDIGVVTADTGVALELWTGVDTTDEACTSGSVAYGYLLVPWLDEGVINDFTIENDAITFTLAARTRNQHQWGVGPYDVMEQDGAGTPGPLLSAFPAEKHFRLMKTIVDPPAVTA